MAEVKDTFLTYKGKPLVRCGKTVYYGDMSDPYVVCLNIQSDKEFKDITLSEKVLIQLISTDPEVINPKEKIIKKSEKSAFSPRLTLAQYGLKESSKSSKATTARKRAVCKGNKIFKHARAERCGFFS